eukprot:TRINITY_DN1124_c0_g1_i6.p1 TRINITY_DN1124_c0_g1~~TRINITY_DN1124_c0_g1_i6.p1  ORF type:complete len:185 (+),score=28.87 TRINITY_DN1124_c0_g1_i6:165-719(+)
MVKLVFNEDDGPYESIENDNDETMEGGNDEQGGGQDLSELRNQALGDATARIRDMAQNDQHAALSVIMQNSPSLNALFEQPNPEVKTLAIVLYVFFNDAPISTFEVAQQAVLSPPSSLIPRLQSFSAQAITKEQYLRLCGFFVDGFSLYPEFTLNKLSNFGKLGEALYEWCDASFTLAHLIYDD